MKKRKTTILIAFAAVLAILGITCSLAFYVASTDTRNLITFGNLELKINETELDSQGNEIAFDASKKVKLNKKNQLSRIIRFENIGDEPMYIRACLSLPGVDMNGRPLGELDEVTAYTLNENDWIYKDGWYYYKEVLEPESESEALITGVEFDINQISSRYNGGDFDLDVYVQGVQSKNNEHTDILSVKGWPEMEGKNE